MELAGKDNRQVRFRNNRRFHISLSSLALEVARRAAHVRKEPLVASVRLVEMAQEEVLQVSAVHEAKAVVRVLALKEVRAPKQVHAMEAALQVRALKKVHVAEAPKVRAPEAEALVSVISILENLQGAAVVGVQRWTQQNLTTGSKERSDPVHQATF